jgi:PAS domain S-box-containing protein
LASELQALRGRVADLERVAREHESCRRALRASEQRLRDLADGSIQGILIHRDFRILYVNPAFARMMGCADADELLGKDLLRELDSSLAPEQRRALYEARLRGEPVPERFEVARRRKDGELMWMEMLVRVVEWEGAPAVQATCQDVTPYRRALDELRASEQRFKDFAEVSSDWFWETSPDHRFTYISDRFAQVAGLRAEDLVGRARWELARPDSDPMDWSEHRADLEARRAIHNFHFSYYDSAGRRRFVNINGKPIFTDDGLFLGYRGTGTDITAQMEAREAAARAHARLIDAIENMPAAFALYDAEDRLVLINSKVRQWFAGYADCFQLGRRYEELVRCAAESGHLRDALRDPEAWCRERIGLFHNPPERLEVALTDGRWVRSLDRRTSEGGTVAIRVDITELKRAEEALRGSEQRFKDFAEVASDWFWEMGPDLRFSFFSERFAEATGLDPGACLGLQRWEMPRPEHDRVDWEAHQENLARRRPFRGFVYPYFDRDGLERYARISGKPVFASDGAFLGYRGTGTDITAEVEARREADRAHARLVDAVESIPAAFLLFDREHRLLLCNEKSKEYFPHLAHLFAVGTSLIDIARYAAAHGLVAEAIGREEEWVRERLRQFDNPPPTLEQLRLPERRWLQVLDRKTREGGMVSIRMDITELKQREEELRKSEERFRGLAEGSIQAIIVHRLFNPLFVNQAFVDMFGYASAEEVLAIDMRDLPYIAPTERERLMGYAHARLRGEPAPSRFRFEGLRKDGTPVWAEVVASTVKWDGELAILGTYTDITDLVKSEEAHRKSEEKYRNLVDGSIQGILVHRDFKPLFVNQAYAKVFGYETAEEIIELGSLEKILQPAERARVTAIKNTRMKGEPAPAQYEFQGIGKDGTAVWIDSINSVIEWDGQPAILSTQVNVTERKLAAQALRASEERYRRLVEHSLQGMVVVREEAVIFANRAEAEMFGFTSPDEMIGTSFNDRIAPEELDRLVEYRRKRLRGERAPNRYEFRGIRKDGRTVWVEVLADAILWEGQPAVQAVHLDITERKLAEHALLESETRFRTLVEGSIQGILVHRGFKPLFVNQAYADIFGYPSREAALAVPDITGTFVPEQLDWARQRNQDQLEGKRVPLIVEREAVRADGAIAWVEVLPTVIEWEGEPAFLVSYVDITERKRGEQVLRESEQRFRDLVEGSLEGIIIHRDFKPLFVNEAMAGICGYESPGEMLGLESTLQVHAPQERERVRAYYHARIKGEEAPARYEAQWLRKDGRAVWVAVQSRLIEWKGAPAVQSTVIEITERRRAEEELRSSRELLQTVFDALPLWVSVKNKEGYYLMVNRKRVLDSGISAEEYQGRHTLDLDYAPRELLEQMLEYDRRAMESGVAVMVPEFSLRLPNGRTNIHRAVKVPLRGEGEKIVGTVSVSEDVTERRRAEEELRSSRELLQTVFDALPLWVSVKNKEGYYLMVNRKRQVETGLTADQYRRLHTLQLPYATEEILRETVRRDRRVIETGEALDFEYEMLLPDGRFRIHHTFKLPLRGPRGEIVGVVAVAEDITERKMLEDQLRQAQKMEAIGQLAGGVAHDFNNLLQIISGYCQFALSEIGDSQIKRDLHEVVAATERGSHLTRQLLAFGRRHLLHRVDIHINDAILNLAGMLKRLFEEHIELLVVPGKDLAPVHADAGLIEQVLMNLCLNARDAMPKGGVLTISSENVELDRAFCEGSPWAQPGRYVRITVADTGEGIRPEHLERVFEPFFTTKNLGKGTGLGLAMAYGIVKQHNGIIRAESELGKGARFTIFLPAASGVGAEARAVEPSVPLGGHETILVAEDEPRVRDMTERVLRGAGYAVLTASNGDEAVALLETRRIDLVVLDVIMPKKDGRTVYEIIRARMGDVPVLFCSGYSTVALGDALLREDNVRLIQKPYLAEELLHAVRAVLDRRPERGQTGPPAAPVP